MTTTFSPRAVLDRYPADDGSLPTWLAARCAVVPDAQALVFAHRNWCYRQLHAAVETCAGVLAGHGVNAGDPVAYCASNSDLTVVVFLACARLGALFAPLNAALTDSELGWLLKHTAPRVVLAGAAEAVRFNAFTAHSGNPPQFVPLETLGLAARDADTVIRVLRALHAPALGGPQPEARTPLVVVYTSGTTGFPKGVLHSHHNYLWAAEAFVERMHLQPDERLLTVLPFFHINALFYSLGGALAAGACLIIAEGFSASRFWNFAAETRATQFNTLAAVGGILCKRPRSEFNPDHVLRKIYGGPISPEVEAVFRADFGVTHVIEGYGMSEIPGACNNPFDGLHKPGSMGLPARHPRHGAFVEMRVIDEAGAPCATNEPGELEVRTPIVFNGYLRDESQTQAAFNGAWFRTGDVVRRDADGYFFFVARRKDIIRVRGENVSGAELDRVLGEHPAVAEAAVLGVAAAVGDEDILAVLVARGARPPFEEIAQWARQHLAAIKIPRLWVWADSLPHTPSHRVAKHLLRKDAALLARASPLP
jgi:crotonobetaine/carnitine-CoA ligase